MEEKRVLLEVGVEHKAPLSALHSKNLHLSAAEALRGHSEETSKNYLSSTQKPRESKEQMVSEPILKARRDAELALHQPTLHTFQRHPICLPQAPGGSTQAGALGLEWFPELRPNYDGLSVFPGKPFHEGVGITTKTPTGNFSQGQRGNVRSKSLC